MSSALPPINGVLSTSIVNQSACGHNIAATPFFGGDITLAEGASNRGRRALKTDTETIEMCRSMFSRFARGQELLRRNHGVPVLNQQEVLDMFIAYLNVQCRVPAEVIEMLQRMRSGSFMNNAGGTSGGRLQMSQACMCKEPAFFESVCESFFRSGPTVHFELFPSTTKSIEAFVSLLAFEANLRERPIKVLLPSDSHYCWGNIMTKYDVHPYLHFYRVTIGSDEIQTVRLRQDDFVLAIFTLANTVSGRTTELQWFQQTLEYVRRQGASPHVFVDAALSGCVISRDVLNLRADAPPDGVAGVLGSAIGLVQSGFKDYGLSSLLFIDDAPLECCSTVPSEVGLASTVAGGAHALIKHAPVTSIPESPTLAFLIFAREYTAFRRQSFNDFMGKLQSAIPDSVEYELRPLFPLMHIEFANEALTTALTATLVKRYSLITIDAEPRVLRLWPTPTNHDIAEAIQEWFEEVQYKN
eukprot:CAMPEP_0119319388 /NCGR_PEP_ID=MMETSP1333-20130426/49229_1 /TAXON_ID=418940 /ORGANISM="Scyphosphaera apsteinii, Strain RCC1455" /LENGTH=470 /DNA_ID=CAMNT_0007325781 /DNA_START=44 /DNA_END=1456 /DNA_ORIENTATION=+